METKTEYWDNGNIQSKTDYHQGQRHGKHLEWHENGQKWWEADYHEGLRHGKSFGWYKDGQLEWEAYYLYGQEVSQEEYEKHQLIIQLSGITDENENRILA